MWSHDFDDFPLESKRKRRKIETKKPMVLNVKEPTKIEDLATHSKKIAEVRSWLEFANNSSHVLLLTGPTGCAKTTTLKVVAKHLGIEVEEWVNPLDKLEFSKVEVWLEGNPYDSSSYVEPKQIEKFESFAFMSSRYQPLLSKSTKRLILVEDFPNHFIWKPASFFEFLARFKILGLCPIVFICTDDDKMNLSNNLFPNYIRDNMGVTNIKFNAISTTAMIKVLQRSAEFLSKDVLSDVAKNANGDLRTALSSIQFMMAGSKGVTKQASEISGKENLTDFYQTLGRVLYPKRKGAASPDNSTFVYDVRNIAEHYNHTFLNMLQENFLNTFTSLKDITVACSYLSDCDLFHQKGEELEKYAAFTCVTGLMVANKEPKKGVFQPLNRSRWSLKDNQSSENWRKYSKFSLTPRTLNLEFMPYFKYLPQYSINLLQADVDRLRTAVTRKYNAPIFKVPLPSQNSLQIEDEEMIIEEFEDD